MSVWNEYETRIINHGGDKRTAIKRREQRFLNNRLSDSLSFFKVEIDGNEQYVEILNSDNLNEKTICSKPNETLPCGGLVYWMDNYWLITELDANNEIYTKGKLVQCNHLLKWVDDNDVICQQWCVVEDGTKYLTGEYEDRNFVVTRGDSRISMTISRNENTLKFNREHRFLIDDADSEFKTAYALTKPLKVGYVYNGSGVFSFVLQEVVSTDDDNHELGIADYYKHFPDERPDSDIDTENTERTEQTSSGKKVWI